MAYGQTDVNSGARGGEFLTGSLNFYQIVTVVPCYPTNVKTPLLNADGTAGPALKARNWPSLSAARSITVVDGNGATVVYDDNAEYISAYNKQQNLNTLLNVFSTRANPVVVSVSSSAIADGTGATVLADGVNAVDFGSTYNGAVQGYFINIATERNPAWLLDETTVASNTNGYQLMATLNGTPVLNTTATTPAGPQDATAVAVTVAGGAFVVSDGDNNRNIIAKLRNEL